MADDSLKKEIRGILKKVYFNDPDDLVWVSDGSEDEIDVVIFSHKFNGKRMKEKHDMIWSLLTQNLTPEQWGKISLLVGRTPEEIKAM